jgi:single-stranded-DNA-specific exonuclease
VATERVDAVASIGDVSLELADELARLEPFGLGNPGVAVLLPAVEVADARALGSDGKHLRYVVRSSAGSCRVVQWGAGRQADELTAGRYDVVARVERNDWNGSSSVQLVARGALPLPDRLAPPAGLCATDCDAGCPARARPSAVPAAVAGRPGPGGARRHPPVAAAALAELVRLAAGGEPLLVVVADVARRRGLLRHALHPARFGLDGALLFSRRCADSALDARLELAADGAWIALADHDTLARRPELAGPFRHVAILDPPASAAAADALDGLPDGTDLHPLAGPQEHALARRLHAARAPRQLAAAVWRALDGSPAAADELFDRLCADAAGPDAAETAWALEVLEDAGLVVRDGETYVRAAAPAGRVDLAVVPGYAEAVAAHEAGAAVLDGRRVAVAV